MKKKLLALLFAALLSLSLVGSALADAGGGPGSNAGQPGNQPPPPPAQGGHH